MSIKRIALIAACAMFFPGVGVAASPSEHEPVVGFGSGTGMGPGGTVGSASSVSGGFITPPWNSGAGSQSFGGGFNQQQTTGSGPLSSNPSASTGAGPVLTKPY